MIICTMCGNQNDDSYAFCGDCGKFLEWNGEKVAPPPEVITVVEEPPPPVEERLTWWQRVRKRIQSWFPERVYVAPRHEGNTATAVAAWASSEPVPVPAPAPAGAPPPLPPPPGGAAAPPALPPPPGAKAALPPPPGAAAALPPPPGAAKALPPPPGKALPPPPGAALPPPPGAALPPPPGAAVPPAPAAAPPPPAAKAVPPPPAAKLPPPPAAPKPSLPGGSTLPPPPGGSIAVAAPEQAAKPTVDPELVASLAVPVSGLAEARPEQPPEVAPAPAIKKTRAIVRTKPTRRLEPGDLVCAVCGEGNAPTRNFCSRCGESLADAGVVHLVWWRRIFRRRKKKLPLGTRPGAKGTREHRAGQTRQLVRRLRAVVLVVGVFLGLMFIAYPPFRETVRDNAVALYRKIVPTMDPVRPSVVQSSTANPGHGANLTVDTYKDTYWIAEADRDKPKITYRFDDSVLLRNIILYSGSSNSFAEDGRPSILRLTYNTGKSETVTPTDSSTPQTIQLKNTTLVSSVTLEVVDVYNGTQRDTVAISEVEFFALK
ncbi:NADase-type glycan-binding domain-containing protein [Labedaea rhizosphaerae]|uniref:NAD glycohydrolase translocation F5/8 type C domain-containing protein n=1 Tax=Labedaea rhizosphaerae TaxID=598644 RepID=A0A4R6SGF7_LABRH|nr:hypothetical protein [Labedaea rhizosphaerae]TDQ00784.1 hypothetical protein EV186_102650 [Labedaea rhizosphaerae]